VLDLVVVVPDVVVFVEVVSETEPVSDVVVWVAVVSETEPVSEVVMLVSSVVVDEVV
jgi:hypothetical protein